MTEDQIHKCIHVHKEMKRAYGETLNTVNNITMKFYEILTQTERDISKNWDFAFGLSFS